MLPSSATRTGAALWTNIREISPTLTAPPDACCKQCHAMRHAGGVDFQPISLGPTSPTRFLNFGKGTVCRSRYVSR